MPIIDILFNAVRGTIDAIGQNTYTVTVSIVLSILFIVDWIVLVRKKRQMGEPVISQEVKQVWRPLWSRRYSILPIIGLLIVFVGEIMESTFKSGVQSVETDVPKQLRDHYAKLSSDYRRLVDENPREQLTAPLRKVAAPHVRLFYTDKEVVDGFNFVVSPNEKNEFRTLGFRLLNDGNAVVPQLSIRLYLWGYSTLMTLPQFPGQASAWGIVPEMIFDEPDNPSQLYLSSPSPISPREEWLISGWALRIEPFDKPIKAKLKIFFGADKPKEINFTVSRQK